VVGIGPAERAPVIEEKSVSQNQKNLRLGVVLGFVLILGATLPARAQGPARSEAGIDEELGKQVALDAALKDESGNDVTLRQLIDKPTILVFIYFRCPGICPLLLNGVADVLNQVTLQPGKDFQAISVSFDPRDTPEMAQQKRVNCLNQMKRPFPPKAWRFLTGNAQATKAVADSVGFGFRPQGDMFMHPVAIMVLTSKGIVTRYMYGTTFLPADVEMAIQEATRGQARPTISKVLAFCYSYDPERRQYVFRMTRVAGTAILVLAGGFVTYLLLAGKARKKTRSPE
jgi:protein SCO1/2